MVLHRSLARSLLCCWINCHLSPSSRHKKCIRYSEGDDEQGPKEPIPEDDDDVIEDGDCKAEVVATAAATPPAEEAQDTVLMGADCHGSEAILTLTQSSQHSSIPIVGHTEI